MTDKNRNAIIASNIKALIKRDKITQKQLAESINISPSTLSDYMNLRSNPSHGVIQKIADYFNVLKSDIDSTYKETQSSTTLSQITETSAKLEEPRQQSVLTFAEEKLHEQQLEQALESDNVTDENLEILADEVIKRFWKRTLENLMKVVEAKTDIDDDLNSGNSAS
ncbi:helix-turn-helix transcriptional regulator [Listeria monocytogenes]